MFTGLLGNTFLIIAFVVVNLIMTFLILYYVVADRIVDMIKNSVPTDPTDPTDPNTPVTSPFKNRYNPISLFKPHK